MSGANSAKRNFRRLLDLQKRPFGAKAPVLTTLSVLVNVLNQKAPFFVPKSAKSAPNFFFKKRHNLRLFLFGKKLKMTHHAIFIAFLCDNFSQISNSNIFPKIFNTTTGKSLFFKIFLPAPNIFWRHKEFQNSHSGAKAPLLTTLILTNNQKCLKYL